VHRQEGRTEKPADATGGGRGKVGQAGSAHQRFSGRQTRRPAMRDRDQFSLGGSWLVHRARPCGAARDLPMALSYILCRRVLKKVSLPFRGARRSPAADPGSPRPCRGLVLELNIRKLLLQNGLRVSYFLIPPLPYSIFSPLTASPALGVASVSQWQDQLSQRNFPKLPCWGAGFGWGYFFPQGIRKDAEEAPCGGQGMGCGLGQAVSFPGR